MLFFALLSAVLIFTGCLASYSRTLQPGEFEKMPGREIVFSDVPPSDDRGRWDYCKLADWHLEPSFQSTKIGPEFTGKHAKLAEVRAADRGLEQYQSAVLEDGRTVFYYLGISAQSPKNFNLVYFPDDLDALKKRVGSRVWLNLLATVSRRDFRVDDKILRNVEELEISDVRPRTQVCHDYTAPYEVKVKRTDGSEGFLPYRSDYYFDADPMAGWSVSIREKVQQGTMAQGMTDVQLRLSWGKPDKINKTVLPDHTNEQWVYRRHDTYVYLRDGIVTSWQTTKTER